MGIPIHSRHSVSTKDSDFAKNTQGNIPQNIKKSAQLVSKTTIKKSWNEYALILMVFALTGSSTAKLGHYVLTQCIGLEGSILFFLQRKKNFLVS